MIAKLTSGYSAATLPTDGDVGEADRDDRVVAGVGEGAQALLASRLGLTVTGLGLLGRRRRTPRPPGRDRRQPSR